MSQWRTYNSDWGTWNNDNYGNGGRSQSRGRYGSWNDYYGSESSWGNKKDDEKGYWVGDWWYCGYGDWYWSKESGYVEWRKKDEGA
mmetsp:Transcript_7498/g.6417  ORF Transcript_7498/g.6417 Transcript_7498/m.6417 type:complete len:86 (+) Transcript_7498:1-258(+)